MTENCPTCQHNPCICKNAVPPRIQAEIERDEWLWSYSLIQSILERAPGWETAKEYRVSSEGSIAPLRGAVLAKDLNRALDKFKDLNEDKFRTIAAYTRMASLDKWKIGRLIDAIDQYISAQGYSEHSKLLTEARADVINCKTGMFPDQPKETQWNPK